MTDSPRILILADDLTGAMDAAGPFAARGLPTWVAALPDECDASRFARATVVSVNTESRHLPPDEAARRISHAWRQVGGEAFQIVVKKVDSTLRGNVLSETLAALEVSGRGRVVVAPAFPAQGRVVRGGEVLVRGEPLAATAFARDALSSALTEPLAQAFGRVAGPAGAENLSADAFATRDAQVTAWAVVDAQTDAELDVVARACLADPARWLQVGSAGLTGALARQLPVPAVRPEVPAVLGRIVYVIGSRAKVSRDQADTLIGEGARLLEAVNGRLRTEPVLAPGADAVLMAVPDAQGREGDATEVALMLARHAMRLVGAGNAQAIVATGGDTAIAFLRASGNPALAVVGELMPGIAYARFMAGPRPVWLVTKAGGFGDAHTLRNIGRLLRVGAPTPVQ